MFLILLHYLRFSIKKQDLILSVLHLWLIRRYNKVDLNTYKKKGRYIYGSK